MFNVYEALILPPHRSQLPGLGFPQLLGALSDLAELLLQGLLLHPL